MALSVKRPKPRIGELRTLATIKAQSFVKDDAGGGTRTQTADPLGPFPAAVVRASEREVFEWSQRGSRVSHFVWIRAASDIVVSTDARIEYSDRMNAKHVLRVQGRPEDPEERGFWLRIPCSEIGAEDS